jgi:hypothetical protein
LLALGGPERAPCADVHKIGSAHLANVRNKLSDLIKLESILAETVRNAPTALPRLPGARYFGCWPAKRARPYIRCLMHRSDKRT